MEKKLIAAVVISTLILIVWSGITKKYYPVGRQSVATKDTAIGSPQQPAISSRPETNIDTLIAFDNDRITAHFSEKEAAIWEVVFKKYQNSGFHLKYAFLLDDNSLAFKKSAMNKDSVSFTAVDKDKRISKIFKFDPKTYGVTLEIIVENTSLNPIDFRIPLILGEFRASNDSQGRFEKITVSGQDKIRHPNLRKPAIFTDTSFISYGDRYFTIITDAQDRMLKAKITPVGQGETEISLLNEKITLLPKQKEIFKYNAYVGPQDLKIITEVKSQWSTVINFGMFDFIAQLLLQMLEFFYRVGHNWGIAIILLSIAIYFILFPLSLKQIKSMRQMQELQPKIEELRKTYKDNPQRLNKEIMELYRRYKINPLGGCLPVLLQIPVFFALYQVLIRSVALKGAEFLWIKDLSIPDKIISLPGTYPLIGNSINLLPIFMSVSMFFQQKLSSTTQMSTSSEQQKMMQILFPIIFVFIFYNMPAGLVLYWLVNNVLMLLQQLRMNRISKAATVS